MSERGRFLDFYLPYRRDDGSFVPASEQADEILAMAGRLVARGAPGIAVLYSANHGQTRTIADAYERGRATIAISGANQAEVMARLQAAPSDRGEPLRGRLRIAPITTMNGYGSEALPNWGPDLHLEVLETDVRRIEGWLEDGWSVLGWQNQDTVGDPGHPYAIGGGIASMSPEIDGFIQGELMRLAREFGGRTGT